MLIFLLFAKAYGVNVQMDQRQTFSLMYVGTGIINYEMIILEVCIQQH